MKSVLDVEVKAWDKSDEVHFDIVDEIKKLKLPRMEFETMPTDWGTYWFGSNDVSYTSLGRLLWGLNAMYKDKLIRGYKIVETKSDGKPVVLEKWGSPVPRTPLSKYPIQTRKRAKFLQALRISKPLSRRSGSSRRTSKTRASRPSSRTNRPSPSESATKFQVGTKKKGNDGNMWVIKENKNGTKRWAKY